MNPLEPSPSRRRRLSLFAVITLVLVGAGGLGYRALRGGPSRPQGPREFSLPLQDPSMKLLPGPASERAVDQLARIRSFDPALLQLRDLFIHPSEFYRFPPGEKRVLISFKAESTVAELNLLLESIGARIISGAPDVLGEPSLFVGILWDGDDTPSAAVLELLARSPIVSRFGFIELRRFMMPRLVGAATDEAISRLVATPFPPQDIDREMARRDGFSEVRIVLTLRPGTTVGAVNAALASMKAMIRGTRPAERSLLVSARVKGRSLWVIQGALEALRANNAFERVELDTEAGPASISAVPCGQPLPFKLIAQGEDDRDLHGDTGFLIRGPDDWDSFRERRRIAALDLLPKVPSAEGKSVALLMLSHKSRLEGHARPLYELEMREATSAGEDVCIRVRRSVKRERNGAGSTNTNFIAVELEGTPRQVRFLDEAGEEITATPWPAESPAGQLELLTVRPVPPEPIPPGFQVLLQGMRSRTGSEAPARPSEAFVAHTPEELSRLWQSLGANGSSVQVDFATQSVVAFAWEEPQSDPKVLQLREVKLWDNVAWFGLRSDYVESPSWRQESPFIVLAVPGKPEVVYFTFDGSFGSVIAGKRGAAAAQ